MHKSEHSTHELARSNGFTDGATDRRYLDIARYEAETSFSEGGIPVGAVLVRNGRRVGQGHNQRVQRGNAILHGEMDCLVNAGRQTTYADTTLYTTLSPCMMCTGTILQFGIPNCKIVPVHIMQGLSVVYSVVSAYVVCLPAFTRQSISPWRIALPR